MKTQVIPAQITTVEDTIVGSLSFGQLLLLMAPVALIVLVYALLPPTMALAWYKVGVVALVSLPIMVLAIRFRGVVVLDWVQLVGSYLARPRLFVSDKNDGFGRQIPQPEPAKQPVVAKRVAKAAPPHIQPSTASLLAFEYQLSERRVALRVVPAAKGGVRVVLD